jgi:parallel beta-helix repeat protein
MLFKAMMIIRHEMRSLDKFIWLTVLLLSFCLQTSLIAQPNFQKDLQTQLILAEPGDTIRIPAGRFTCTSTLSLDEKQQICIEGAGMGKTFISFKGQTQGAEGLKLTNSTNITLRNITLEDAKGDIVKAQQVHGLVFDQVEAIWTGKPSAKNGGYALYPVQCSKVLINKCIARGASDSGIYVGQSDSVVVQNSLAEYNVAGIEIENTTNALVENNEARNNTGGILIFDLPDLPKKQGGNTEVRNNLIVKNNYKNFAPKGNIVGKVPPGTGIMVLATNKVNIHHNKIQGHKTVSCAVVSYYITENPIKDKDYLPYPALVRIQQNEFARKRLFPTFKNKLGILFFLKFGRRVPNILWDGIENTDWTGPKAQGAPEYIICVDANEQESYANLKADKKFKGISRDLSGHRCKKK